MMTPGPSITTALERWARERPDASSFIFLAEDDSEEAHLTFRELRAKVVALAAKLHKEGLQGERVLLLYPTSIGFVVAFLACLYAGAVAVPMPPPHPARLRALKRGGAGEATRGGAAARFAERIVPRLRGIVADSGAAAALTSEEIASSIDGLFELAPELAQVRWIAADGEESTELADGLPLAPDGARLALLQYTSGSTSSPKGVMVTHGNLAANAEQLRLSCGSRDDEVFVTWLPNYHDMGLVDGLMHPLYMGRPVVALSPAGFMGKPIRWLRAISKYRGTHSGAPNFAFDLCVKKISEEQKRELDLSCWRFAYNGAEPVRADTMRTFARAFACAGLDVRGLVQVYGLAEATLIVAGGAVDEAPKTLRVSSQGLRGDRATIASALLDDMQELVSAGTAVPGTEIRVVDGATGKMCDEGMVGEIWISGPSIAVGYWGNESATQETFRAMLSDGSGPYMRTGDLGFMYQGQLYVAGRKKDVIIIRGHNYYPQDIEWSVEHAHEKIAPGASAAFAIDESGAIGIMAEVIPSTRDSEYASIMEKIRQVVHMEQQIASSSVVLVRFGSSFQTSSGKIQRQACKRAFLENTLDVLARWDAPSSNAACAPRPHATLHQGLHGVSA